MDTVRFDQFFSTESFILKIPIEHLNNSKKRKPVIFFSKYLLFLFVHVHIMMVDSLFLLIEISNWLSELNKYHHECQLFYRNKTSTRDKIIKFLLAVIRYRHKARYSRFLAMCRSSFVQYQNMNKCKTVGVDLKMFYTDNVERYFVLYL